MQINPSPANISQRKLLPLVDLIVTNESEAEILTNIKIKKDNFKEILEKFQQLGVKNSLITLGKRGSCTYINNQVQFVDSYKVETVDTTGAGDTYLGALASELIKGNNIINSMNYAKVASALAVTRRGAQNSIPSRQEVEKILRK